MSVTLAHVTPSKHYCMHTRTRVHAVVLDAVTDTVPALPSRALLRSARDGSYGPVAGTASVIPGSTCTAMLRTVQLTMAVRHSKQHCKQHCTQHSCSAVVCLADACGRRSRPHSSVQTDTLLS